MKNTITTLFLFISVFSFSQEKGSVYLRVFPQSAIIKLNDSLLKSHQTYPLDTGVYLLKMWSPKREYVERNVKISENKTTQFLEVLSYTEEYKKYKKKKFLYNLQKVTFRYAPPIVLGWFLLDTKSTLSNLSKEVDEQYDLAIDAKSKYEDEGETNRDQLLLYKESYEIHSDLHQKKLDTYNQSRKNRMMIGGAIVLTTVALEYLSFKLKKPNYEEKVLLSSFGVANYNNNLVPSFLLTYKF
jgi:hypothetical protein